MKKILTSIALSILLFSCTKQNLIEKPVIGSSLQSVQALTPTTYRVIFSLDGVIKSAIATEIKTVNGMQYTLANVSTQYFSLKLSPTGEITDWTFDPLLRCMVRHATLCKQQMVCRILCVGGSNMSCVLGFALGCAAGIR